MKGVSHCRHCPFLAVILSRLLLTVIPFTLWEPSLLAVLGSRATKRLSRSDARRDEMSWVGAPVALLIYSSSNAMHCRLTSRLPPFGCAEAYRSANLKDTFKDILARATSGMVRAPSQHTCALYGSPYNYPLYPYNALPTYVIPVSNSAITQMGRHLLG
jgi:hypothetical protein